MKIQQDMLNMKKVVKNKSKFLIYINNFLLYHLNSF